MYKRQVIFRDETAVKLIGQGSIGFVTLVIGIVLSFVFFIPFYIYGLNIKKETLSKKQLVFNVVTLSIATAVMPRLVTCLLYTSRCV